MLELTNMNKNNIDNLPVTPGVYLFKNAQGDVLYVGKAKKIRSRVRSYFRPQAALEAAKQRMMGLIEDIETIATDTEHEALVLEANLIQKHKPPYNVILRDDKFYLFIKITRETVPRVLLTRRLQDDARYFGPYSSARSVRGTLKLLQRIFPFQGSEDSSHQLIFPHPLFPNRSQPSSVEVQTYRHNIDQLIRFLRGERHHIISTLRTGMNEAAARSSFEQAAIFRDQLLAVQRLDEQQKVYLPKRENLDVVSIAQYPHHSAANVFSIRQGKLLNKSTFLLHHRSTVPLADVLRQFLLQYYRVAQDIPPHIALPTTLPDQRLIAQWINRTSPPEFFVPERGLKKQLIKLGQLNAQQFLQQQYTQQQTPALARQALDSLSQQLNVSHNDRIEIYDISNIQGTSASGAMVVFEQGRPVPQKYRRFKLNFPSPPNDYAMIEEVLNRRFSGRHTDWPSPDLIIIDGGKGHLSIAQKTLSALHLNIPLIALAKQFEEVFQPGRPQPLRLPSDSPALFLLQRMRDEAHRFALGYHRLLRQKKQRQSQLDQIPGIGPHTKKILLKNFGSFKNIQRTPLSQLAQVIGKRADLLKPYLQP